jgi:hypothetical protein
MSLGPLDKIQALDAIEVEIVSTIQFAGMIAWSTHEMQM